MTAEKYLCGHSIILTWCIDSSSKDFVNFITRLGLIAVHVIICFQKHIIKIIYKAFYYFDMQ